MTYDQALDIYRALVEDSFGLALKGKANPYTSLNGNMFSFLDRTPVLCLRLSKADQTAFWDSHGGDPVVQYGAVMKEYVAVPEAILNDDAALEAVFQKCLAHAETLKPKPTKKT